MPSAAAIPLCFTCTFLARKHFFMLGGILLDFFGIRKALLIYTSTITLGAILLTIGGATNDFSVMLIGRTLTSAGAEVFFNKKKSFISNGKH